MRTAKLTLALGLIFLAACEQPPKPPGPTPDEIVEAQTYILRTSSDYTVRCCAATAIGIMGPKVVEAAVLAKAVAALEEAAQHDHEPSVREAAERALNHITSALSKVPRKDAVRS